MNKNIKWHEQTVTYSDREAVKNQKGVCIWFTGLSGSGKSTLANLLESELNSAGYHTYLLDGDNVRHGLNSDLGFDEKSRSENIRRIGEVASLFVDAGIIVLTAFISPFKKHRELVRSKLQGDRFIEIFVDADLSVCEKRDPKGLYKKARTGEITDFTGISSNYEKPEKPEMIFLNNEDTDPEVIVEQIYQFLNERNYIY